jgi:DNA-binding transcriptional regulator LsrR (DeoR family)
MSEHEITESFLKALERYFAGEVNARDAAKEADLSGPNKFLEVLKDAYKQNYIVIRSPLDQPLCDRFRQWVGLTSKLEPYILKGSPDDRTFSLKAAETFLIYLRRLLLNDRIKNVTIGVVSGSSTASLVEALVTSSLWEEVISPEEEKNIRNKLIRVVSLNANPVKGWELQADANISVFRLAGLLRQKLCEEHKENGNKVEPMGITSSSLVIQEPHQNKEVSTIDRELLEITDPKRLDSKGASSKIDIIITGIGSPEDSIFTQIMKAEGIKVPKETVGDVAYSPVDKDGRELSLTRDGVSYSVYSAIRLVTMKELVESGSVVLLVARNSRRGKPANKTLAIRAAILGKYVNVICTDEKTALKVMEEPA